MEKVLFFDRQRAIVFQQDTEKLFFLQVVQKGPDTRRSKS
jgi:hypothetical protein